MPATMEIITNEVKEQGTFRGASQVDSISNIPEYRGGVTLTFQVIPQFKALPPAQITIDPEVHGGVPCIGDGNWPISQILENLVSNVSIERFKQNFPGLTLADIQLALKAAAWVMRDPSIEWAELNLSEMVDFQQEMLAWQGMSDSALNLIEDLSRG